MAKKDDNTLGMEGTERPIAGRRRFSNAPLADQRAFSKAYADERVTTWKASDGTVYKINRRGNISQAFSASTEVVSKPSRSEKLRMGRAAKVARNQAIRRNASKRVFGETRAQKEKLRQGQFFSDADVGETDEQIQQRIMGKIKNQAKTPRATAKYLVSQGMGLGLGPLSIGGGLDEVFGLKMGERSGGGGSGRAFGRPGKAKL